MLGTTELLQYHSLYVRGNLFQQEDLVSSIYMLIGREAKKLVPGYRDQWFNPQVHQHVVSMNKILYPHDTAD